MKLRNRLLIARAAVITPSAMLVVGIPAFSYSALDAGVLSNQPPLIAVEVTARFLAAVLPSLGASLVAAGIVIAHLERRGS